MPTEPTLRLITFQLRQNWFCLPLELARKVVPYQTETSTNGFLRLQEETIPLLDVARLIYTNTPQLPAASPSEPVETISSIATNVLIADLPRQGTIGLLIEGTPAMRRVTRSAFAPVPPMYVTMNHMQGINVLVSEQDAEPPMFLLELEKLMIIGGY